LGCTASVLINVEVRACVLFIYRGRRPIPLAGTCRLCRQRRQLVRSHLFGAALYRMCRDPQSANPNPVMVTRGCTVATSRQIWCHLLCRECEHRFNASGEDWMMRQVQRAGHFQLLERLRVAVPMVSHPLGGIPAIYNGTAIGVDTEALPYFAFSVFWRASTHGWRLPDGTIMRQSIGTLEEPVRRYLLGECAAPDQCALVVMVCTDAASQGTFYGPAWIRGDEHTGLSLQVRGVFFRLFMGPNLPSVMMRCSYTTSINKPIILGNCAGLSLGAFEHLMETARPSTRIS